MEILTNIVNQPELVAYRNILCLIEALLTSIVNNVGSSGSLMNLLYESNYFCIYYSCTIKMKNTKKCYAT